MTGKLEGMVALITGAGRGQGRSHALPDDARYVTGMTLPATPDSPTGSSRELAWQDE